MSRPICIDCSALSPKEFDTYRDFIAEFDKFSLPRGGQVRFAEAAQFLRKWFPFDADKEDEIRSFFPQKLQLGQMNQGCVLALLRLLSHLQSQPSSHRPGIAPTLYRDLIFIQTEPLQPLSDLSKLSVSLSPGDKSFTRSTSHASNPFRRPEPYQQPTDLPKQPMPSSPSLSPRHRGLGSSETSLSKSRHKAQHSFVVADIHASSPSRVNPPQSGPPKLPVNPFRQATSSSSASFNAPHLLGSPINSQSLASPPVPPRPTISTSLKPNARTGPNCDDEQAPLSQHHILSLRPPKHYTQQYQQLGLDGTERPEPSSSEDKRGLSTSLFSIQETPRPTTPPLIPSLPKFSKSKILPRIAKSIPNMNNINSLSISPTEIANRPKDMDTSPRPPSGNQGGCTGISLPHAVSSTRSSCPPPPPPPLTKSRMMSLPPETSKAPSKVDQPQFDHVQPPALPRKSNLTRSHTLNQHKGTPPAPPPRKRPESLQIYNPYSVPLEELAKQKTPSGADAEQTGTLWALPPGAQARTARNKTFQQRAVSHDISQSSIDCPSEPNDEEPNRRPRRSSSLQGRDTSGGGEQRTNLLLSINHLKQLKALEHGLRADGRELVKDVKEGWESRHGRRDERVRLVGGNDERRPHVPRVGKIWPNEIRTRPGHWRNDGRVDEDHRSHLDRTSDEEEGWSRLD